MDIPTIEEFVFKTPLYEVISWKEEVETDDEDDEDDGEKKQLVEKLILSEDKLDGYCPECEKETTFKRIGDIPHSWEVSRVLSVSRILVNRYACSRSDDHLIEIFYKTYPIQKFLSKIGQSPSLATLMKGNANKYRNILGKQFNEYSKAIGLVSHGVGIGSFVYLRRIFEKLIEDAHKQASKGKDWNEVDYSKSRVGEKIILLKNFLPDFLVKNSSLYGILSKGIHELSEQECLEIFPVVKLGIELILDDKIRVKEQAEKEKSGSELISKITSKISEKNQAR